MAPGKETVDKLFAKLNISNVSSELEDALKHIKKDLITNSKNVEAQKSLISTLIALDRITEAYHSIVVLGINELYKTIPLETAYVLYRSGHFKDLEDVISHDSRAVRHILAQVLYQEDEFEKIVQIYSSILRENEKVPGEFLDIEGNFSAIKANAALNFIAVSSHDVTPINSHDYFFNAALIKITEHDYNEAIDLLKKAKLSCQNSGLSAEEIANELVPIQVQAAYVNQLSGKSDEALEILEATGLSSIKDAQVRLIALNNLESLKEMDNPNEVLRFINFEKHRQAMTQKTIGFQKKILETNEILLKMLSGRSIVKLSRKFRKQLPEIIGIEVSGLYSELQLEQLTDIEQVKVLKAYLNHHQDNIAATLLLVHVLSRSKKYELASTVLERLTTHIEDEVKYYPGLIAVIVSVLKLQNRKSKACEVISKSINHWNKYSKTLSIPVFELAVSESDSLRKLAENFFKDVLSTEEKNLFNIAGYISSGPDLVNTNMQSLLPNIESLINGIDAEYLNSTGVNPLLSSHNDEYSHIFRSSKRRKTKAKLPKDFDSSKQPDPERWLPKRDRSSYKPKRKERKNAKATQGSASQAADFTNSQSTVIQGKQKNKKKSKR